MSSSTEDTGGSIQAVLLIAAVVLLGGTAPWWMSALVIGPTQGEAQGPSPRTDTAMVDRDTAQTQAEARTENRNGQDGASSDCTVTVLPTSVTVKRTPKGIEAGYARAESGEYAALDHRVVENETEVQGWYKIEVGGKKGWIKHNSLTVFESGSCPP